ncbi:hypothetical protein Tco_0139914 [Tanacetum coccineum]
MHNPKCSILLLTTRTELPGVRKLGLEAFSRTALLVAPITLSFPEGANDKGARDTGAAQESLENIVRPQSLLLPTCLQTPLQYIVDKRVLIGFPPLKVSYSYGPDGPLCCILWDFGAHGPSWMIVAFRHNGLEPAVNISSAPWHSERVLIFTVPHLLKFHYWTPYLIEVSNGIPHSLTGCLLRILDAQTLMLSFGDQHSLVVVRMKGGCVEGRLSQFSNTSVLSAEGIGSSVGMVQQDSFLRVLLIFFGSELAM